MQSFWRKRAAVFICWEADFIHSLDNVEKVEILPYHTMGIYKWKELGLEYPLEGIEPPTKERVENAKKILAI